MSLDSMYKKLNEFYEKFTRIKNVSPQTHNEDLKAKALENAEDLFN